MVWQPFRRRRTFTPPFPSDVQTSIIVPSFSLHSPFSLVPLYTCLWPDVDTRWVISPRVGLLL